MKKGSRILDLERGFPGVSRRSLQRDLRGLVDAGLLVAEGATSNLHYRLREPSP